MIPKHFAIKYPSRMVGELFKGDPTRRTDVKIDFVAGDGNVLTVILTEMQWRELCYPNFLDKEDMNRRLYIEGAIEVDEFERRLK